MIEWWERVKRFNCEMNRLPQKILWILMLIAGVGFALWIFPYVAPFAVAALLAWILNPLVRLITRGLGGNKTVRKIIAAVLVAMVGVLLFFLIMIVAGKLVSELAQATKELPGWIASASAWMKEQIENADIQWSLFDTNAENMLLDTLSKVSSSLSSSASSLATMVARGAWRTAALVPQTVLFVVLTFLGLFYMCADPELIVSFFRRQLPMRLRKRSEVIGSSLTRAVMTQVRAALIMMVVTFVLLTVGFILIGLHYALLFAVIIAVLDALPVIGAGLFLIPGAVYGFVIGDVRMGIGFAVLYLLVIGIRQLLEPRIIGRHLGLNPLATMVAMYAGLRAFGFIGMLLGPLTLMLGKIAFSTGSFRNEGEETAQGTQGGKVKERLREIRKKRNGRRK